MVNGIEALPALTAAAEIDGAANVAGAAQPPATPEAPPGDTFTAGQAGAVAVAYLPYLPGGRGAAAGSPRAFFRTESGADVRAVQSGSHNALIRAALPSALQGQFDAQVAAAAVAPPGGDPAAEEGGLLFSASDLATLVGKAIAGEDAVVSVLIARLTRDVARYGAASMARTLGLARERIAFGGGVTVPAQPPTDICIARVDGDRERPRRQRRFDRDDPNETTARDDAGQPDISINDTVYFNGAPIATHRSATSSLMNERNV